MTWYLQPTYSALEVAIILVLAALPLSQSMSIILGILGQKTGINVSQYGRAKEDDEK